MNSIFGDVADISYALAALSYGGFALYLLISGRLKGAEAGQRRAFLAALSATTAWAVLAWLQDNWQGASLSALSALFDLLRYGAWLAFLLTLQRNQSRATDARARTLRWASLGAFSLDAALLALQVLRGQDAAEVNPLRLGVALTLPVCGLLLVEQLFRNLSEGLRWNAKPVCLGLICVFAFDVYLYAEALLFGRFDADAFSVRGGAHAMAVPLLFIAARRSSHWIAKLQVSRAAAFYSATLLLAGGYLLFMAALGYCVRYFGGGWGRALQLGMLVAGLAFLGMLVLSGALRSWLRVFLGKHFFSYRYDYREEWLHFTAMLSSKRTPQEMGRQIVRGLAKLVESPGGSLWTQNGGDSGGFAPSATWNLSHATEVEPADSSLCRFLQEQGWVIDLDEFRASPQRYGSLALPTWLLGAPNGWLVVPLLAGDELQGFVLLSRPLTALNLNWEVLDLIKTAGCQAAGYLAQMQATEALLEARKFEAFNRMSAFVVHDLKNIVAQLSLMLKNAERLYDNREFQQDMLLTVESSLEKMRRLMLQLREGATPPGGSRGVELHPIVKRLVAATKAQGRTLEVAELERLATRGHAERLERVVGHLVQNALEATPACGRVWIRVTRYSGQVQLEVGDTGAGMSEDFVRNQLFRPFSTTKHSGMGIGSYESAQYIRELGGSMNVDSEVGQGTVITVLLPLFESQRQSDLMPLTPLGPK
jgi:putative PEP-CTERM system histidine kinase